MRKDRKKLWVLWGIGCGLLLWLPACGMPEPGEEGGHGDIVGQIAQSLTVAQASSQYCSTSSVNGLTQQLFAELNCLRAGTLSKFDSLSGIKLSSSNVNAFLQTAAKNSLQKVLSRRSGSTMTVTSALRSLAQQYLLYRWYRAGRCGISLAASPGGSNHESALALDVSNYSSWQNAFSAEGWRWLGSRDPVHFDYKGGGTVSLSGLSIRAFQRLWNRNNPNDKIAEDGAYGPQTEARLAKSPAGGFAQSGCATPQPKIDAALVAKSAKGAYGALTGADASVCPGQSFSFTFSMRNTGDVTWKDTNQNKLGEAVRLGFRTGERLGNDTRISVNKASRTTVKPGETTVFTLPAKAPTQEKVVETEWQMVSELVTWFGPKVKLRFAVTAQPKGHGEACNTGLQGPCADGAKQCVGGKLTCVSKQQTTPEVCNGLDDNCDGKADEGNPQGGKRCAPPEGPCTQGISRCVDGKLICAPSCGEGATESTTTDAGAQDAGNASDRSTTQERASEQLSDSGIWVIDGVPQEGTIALSDGACVNGSSCPGGAMCTNGLCPAGFAAKGCGCAQIYSAPENAGWGLVLLLGFLLVGGRRRL